jgi:hypothetical protein
MKEREPILTADEIDRRRNKELILTEEEYSLLKDRIHKHSDKFNYLGSKVPIRLSAGQHFLYETIKSEGYKSDTHISYPKLGIYLDAYPCDQTIEIEWVDHRRSWEWKFRISEHFFVAEERTILNYLPLWGDMICIYGVWDVRPNWRQLKQAYEKTWWFWRDQDELRDIQINRILNG